MANPLRFKKTYAAQLLYVVLLPLFFISFCLLYNPFDLQSTLTAGGKSFAFHLLMLTCILLGVLSISRLIFFALYKHIDFLWWQYAIWCSGEAIVTSLFLSLYLGLFFQGQYSYIIVLSNSIKLTCLTLIYPYLGLIMLKIIQNQGKDLKSEKPVASDDSLVKFYDEHKRLKMTITPAAIMYISSEANYIKIHYLENDHERTFQIRASMKSLEDTSAKHGLVRCHRSYYVNPHFIKVLVRSKEGYIAAELTKDGLEQIPVSKQYYDQLSNLL